jgi:hydroxymethylpyrimidine/phosphomethylpyrimidine kinase
MQGKVLIIAGSDSGGGAGIQADIKTVTVLGGFATTAISALTVPEHVGSERYHAGPRIFRAGTDAVRAG